MHFSCDLDIHILCSTAISCRLHFPLSRVKKKRLHKSRCSNSDGDSKSPIPPSFVFRGFVCLYWCRQVTNDTHFLHRFGFPLSLVPDSSWLCVENKENDQKGPTNTTFHSNPLNNLEVVCSVLTENSPSQSVRVAHSEVVNRRFTVQHLFPYCSIRENRSETKYHMPLWLPAPNYTGVRISKIDVRAWSWTWWSHHTGVDESGPLEKKWN